MATDQNEVSKQTEGAKKKSRGNGSARPAIICRSRPERQTVTTDLSGIRVTGFIQTIVLR